MALDIAVLPCRHQKTSVAEPPETATAGGVSETSLPTAFVSGRVCSSRRMWEGVGEMHARQGRKKQPFAGGAGTYEGRNGEGDPSHYFDYRRSFILLNPSFGVNGFLGAPGPAPLLSGPKSLPGGRVQDWPARYNGTDWAVASAVKRSGPSTGSQKRDTRSGADTKPTRCHPERQPDGRRRCG